MPHSGLTTQKLESNWLSAELLSRFSEEFHRFASEMKRDFEPVIVREQDPAHFLALFFAAISAGHSVVLVNPAWARQEWQQVQETISSQGKTLLNPGEILIPTGGSTGRIRFARHSWKTLGAAARGFAKHFGVRSVNSVCLLPLFHVSGLMQVVRAIETGGQVFFADWKTTEAGNISETPDDFFLSLVPAQLQRLLRVPALLPWLRNARAIPIGGAASPKPLVEEAAKLGLPLSLSYGSTETAAMVTAQSVSEFFDGDRSSGRPLPHVSIRISSEDGDSVAPGFRGRIFVEAESLFHGYLPGDSKPPLHWASGDLGQFDTEGRLHVFGRSDRIIITGGEKVLPDEIERALLASKLVSDIFVLGLPDAKWGEAVTALYVADPSVSEKELRETLKLEIAPYKIPKQWHAVNEIPRTPHGKIDRKRLKSLIASLRSPTTKN